MAHSLKRTARVAGSLLYYFFRTPTPYLVLAATAVFLWDRCFELGRLARHYGLSINAGGLFAILLNNSMILLALSFGVVFLLGNAPFLHESAMFEWVRSDRKTWTAGRLLYMIIVVMLYLLSIQVMICLETWSLNFGPRWDRVLRTLSTGRSIDGVAMLVPSLLTAKFTPNEALAYTFRMMFLVWISVGIGLFAFSLLIHRMVGLCLASFMIFADFIVEGMLPYRMYYFSPLSWAKLSVVGDAANPYTPKISFVYWALPFLCAALLVLAWIIGVYKKRILDQQFEI